MSSALATLTKSADGTTWSIETPPHESGTVDVVVEWTLNGVAQTPITYTDGFTYYTPVAPRITDPADMTITAGESAVFRVSTPTGTPAPTVTWETFDGSDWVPVTGGTISADGLTLTLLSTVLADSGTQFRAVATNSEGDAVSNPAILTVNPVPAAPTITNPADQTVTAGDSASFTVTATGIPDATVTWEISTDGGTTWVTITNGVSTDGLTLTIDSVTEADSGNLYRAIATNEAGEATSVPAILTVNAAPVAPIDPVDPDVPVPPTEDDGDIDTPQPNVDTQQPVTGGEAPMTFFIIGAIALLLGTGLITGNRVMKRREG